MKFKVALRNLYISQAIILIFLVFAYFSWFPHSFSQLGGFYKTAWMLIIVDLILGPLLVFLVYKENKKYLAFDINVLLSIQLIAFIFGAYSLFLKHPAYAVFSIDRFVLTNVSNIYPQPSLIDITKRYLFSSPKFVVAQLPENMKERNKLFFDVVINGQPDIDSRPKYFSSFDQHFDKVMEKGISLEKLNLTAKEDKLFKSFIKNHKHSYKNFAYFPLTGNNKKNVTWVFDKRTAKPVEILEIDPWNFKLVSN